MAEHLDNCAFRILKSEEHPLAKKFYQKNKHQRKIAKADLVGVEVVE